MRLYRDGLEPEQIAERLGCKLGRVYAYMPKRYGASPETKRMREFRRQGWTYREIAVELDTTIGRVEVASSWRAAVNVSDAETILQLTTPCRIGTP